MIGIRAGGSLSTNLFVGCVPMGDSERFYLNLVQESVECKSWSEGVRVAIWRDNQDTSTEENQVWQASDTDEMRLAHYLVITARMMETAVIIWRTNSNMVMRINRYLAHKQDRNKENLSSNLSDGACRNNNLQHIRSRLFVMCIGITIAFFCPLVHNSYLDGYAPLFCFFQCIDEFVSSQSITGDVEEYSSRVDGRMAKKLLHE